MSKQKNKAKVNYEGFVNPFNPGIGYDVFLDSIPQNKTITDHCKDHLTAEQIEWLINDLKHYENSLK